MKKKDKRDESFKKAVGRRFKEFRKTIKMSQAEFGKELKVYQTTIGNIETGKCFPGIKYQYYLYRKFHLNINWLITGNGEMIIKPVEESKYGYLPELFSHINENDPRFEKYVELICLMQIPEIEQVILGKFAELKVIAEEEIKSFLEDTGININQ